LTDRKVLVSGAAGFIGANATRLLLERGYAVTALDSFRVGDRAYLDGLDVDIREVDILDAERVAAEVEGHHGVVHLAAQTGVPGSIEDPQTDCDINVRGTLNMLDAARLGGVKRFVFASSNAPLGKQDPPATEDKAPLPISPYGASKLAGEAYCLAYEGSWGLGTVALRFGNVYGPYCAHKRSVIAKFFHDISTTGRFTIDGDGTQTRDFVYVGDLCDAIVRGLESDVGGEVFQIANGTETSILDLARTVQKVVGTEVELEHGEARRGDVKRNFAVIEKARSVLGWEPRTELEEGLKITWEWLADWQS
jgi:UDP-glucose 4-epimerase